MMSALLLPGSLGAAPPVATAVPIFVPERFFLGATESIGTVRVFLSHRRSLTVYGVGRMAAATRPTSIAISAWTTARMTSETSSIRSRRDSGDRRRSGLPRSKATCPSGRWSGSAHGRPAGLALAVAPPDPVVAASRAD